MKKKVIATDVHVGHNNIYGNHHICIQSWLDMISFLNLSTNVWTLHSGSRRTSHVILFLFNEVKLICDNVVIICFVILSIVKVTNNQHHCFSKFYTTIIKAYGSYTKYNNIFSILFLLRLLTISFFSLLFSTYVPSFTQTSCLYKTAG